MDDVQLTKALCTILGGIDDWAWRESGAEYTADEVGVSYGSVGSTPDRAVGVRVYGATDELHLGWRRAQLHFRGARLRPDGADELADAAFATLQGLSRVGGVSGVSRLSMAPLGADQNGREERTDNYIIILDNAEAS